MPRTFTKRTVLKAKNIYIHRGKIVLQVPKSILHRKNGGALNTYHYPMNKQNIRLLERLYGKGIIDTLKRHSEEVRRRAPEETAHTIREKMFHD